MMTPTARITVELVLPMNRYRPPLAAFVATLVNSSVDIVANSSVPAGTRQLSRSRVGEGAYYSGSVGLRLVGRAVVRAEKREVDRPGRAILG